MYKFPQNFDQNKEQSEILEKSLCGKSMENDKYK